MELAQRDTPAPEESKMTADLCSCTALEVLLMAEEPTRPVLPVFEIWEEGIGWVFQTVYPFYELFVRNGHRYLHKLKVGIVLYTFLCEILPGITFTCLPRPKILGNLWSWRYRACNWFDVNLLKKLSLFTAWIPPLTPSAAAQGGRGSPLPLELTLK